MPKVTVLIAVYNAAPYLRACLDSLLGQTLTDFQAVCIDDCSTDDSLAILQEYQARDARIEVISLDENRGQAYARNQGLKRACGDYVCMLDADDWFSNDALEKAVEVFESHADTDTSNLHRYSVPSFESITGEEAFRMSLTWQIHGLYMVRREIHQKFPYDDSCRLYSDDNTTHLHYLASRCVRLCKGAYYYRQHKYSSTHSVGVRRFDFLKANESMRNRLLELKVEPELLAIYENKRWLNYVGIYMFYFVHGKELSQDDRRYGLSELHRVWQTIDRRLLYEWQIRKFGYNPLSSWWLFRCQEWIFFTVRGWLGWNY